MFMSVKLSLFDYATSELSQDAFVCWLCAHWNDSDATVCAASQNMLHRMLGSERLDVPVRVIDIERQCHHVDVAMLVEHENKMTILIVEDKTGSSEHDNQLQRYRIGADRLFPDIAYDEVRIVYYKTGPLTEYDHVCGLCDVVLGREDILGLIDLPDATSGNDILADYTAHLRYLEDCYSSYARQRLGEWNDKARAGYAEHLYHRLKDYWANPTRWIVYEKPNTRNGGHWVVSLGNRRPLGVKRLETFIGIEFPPDGIRPEWLFRILIRLDAPAGKKYNREDCGLSTINAKKFTSRRSRVAIVGLIDSVPDTPEGRAVDSDQLDAMVDAAIEQYQGWCDRNAAPDDGIV